MALSGLRRIGAPFLIVTMLGACEQGALTTSDEAEASAEGVTLTGRTETRDVERPDVFSTTEQGLWDGRPSLGGVWVAHPDVTDPERAIITVSETGRKVTGALFRRERNNPGPRIQVSSDAAAALGMLGGQPAALEVVVLRTETVEIPPTPEEIAAAEAAAAAAEAEAAVEAAANAPPAEDVVIEEVDPAEVVPEQPRQRRGLFSIFRRKPAPVVETLEDGADAAAGATGAAVEAVETQPLDTVAIAAGAIDRAEAQATTPAAPWLQVGLYTDQANAEAAAVTIRQAGLRPTVRRLTEGRSTLFRVLVGPAANNAELNELKAELTKLGFDEAFPTAN